MARSVLHHLPSSVSLPFLQHISQLTLHIAVESGRICKSVVTWLEMRCGSVPSGMSVSVLSFLLCHFSCSSSWRCSFPPSLAKLLHTRTDALDWIQPSAEEETMLGHLCMAASVQACVCVCVDNILAKEHPHSPVFQSSVCHWGLFFL